MNTRKFVLLISILIILEVLLFPAERKPARPMKELINPDSPSHVPVPYPQSRKDIIVDLKFGLKRLYATNQDEQLISAPKTSKGAFIDLLRDDPDINIHEIVKVKNRIAAHSKGYTFLITLTDQSGSSIGRVAMDACGLIRCTAKPYNSVKIKPLKNREEILDNLSNYINNSGTKKIIKFMERIAFRSSIGNVLFPVWEVVLDDDSTYYVDYHSKVYMLSKKEKFSRNTDLSLLQRKRADQIERVVVDSVNDEILYLKPLLKLSNIRK